MIHKLPDLIFGWIAGWFLFGVVAVVWAFIADFIWSPIGVPLIWFLDAVLNLPDPLFGLWVLLWPYVFMLSLVAPFAWAADEEDVEDLSSDGLAFPVRIVNDEDE